MADGTPAEPLGRRWMPSYVCRDMQQLEHAGRLYFLGITVTAELTGEERAGPLPVRAGLGGRIADLVRADLTAAADSAPGRPDQLVLHFHWEEGGQQRQETYGPWPAQEDMGHLVQVSEFIKRWRKVTRVTPHAITIAMALDPEAWLRDREQAGTDEAVGACGSCLRPMNAREVAAAPAVGDELIVCSRCRSPLPPEPGTPGLPPRDADGYTIGG